jgi:hypothetical protein
MIIEEQYAATSENHKLGLPSALGLVRGRTGA